MHLLNEPIDVVIYLNFALIIIQTGHILYEQGTNIDDRNCILYTNFSGTGITEKS